MSEVIGLGVLTARAGAVVVVAARLASSASFLLHAGQQFRRFHGLHLLLVHFRSWLVIPCLSPRISKSDASGRARRCRTCRDDDVDRDNVEMGSEDWLAVTALRERSTSPAATTTAVRMTE
jgi:hypothetical protein